MNANKPVEKFEVGAVSVAVFENLIDTPYGQRKAYRALVERRYKDGEEWKSTHSFPENDLPRLILALQKAYEAVAFKKKSGDNGDGNGDGQ